MSERRARVPVALHNELTEYSSLLRALRTQHALDLSAHLSQHVSSSRHQSLGESEASSSGQEDNERARNDKEVLSEPEIAVLPSTATVVQDDDEIQNRKQKRTETDTWTRWPMLSGDVNRPEWDLTDEVQLIASRVLKKRKPATRDNSGGERMPDIESDGDLEDDELNDIASKALVASTAEYLRSLLSACAALVPCSKPRRVAPLNWTTVLGAAAASGLVSSEALHRVGLRMETVCCSSFAIDSTESSQEPPSLPPSVESHVRARQKVQATLERLNSLDEERIEQGDGDFLSFIGPRREAKRRKRTRNKVTKKEDQTEGTPFEDDGVAREAVMENPSQNIEVGSEMEVEDEYLLSSQLLDGCNYSDMSP